MVVSFVDVGFMTLVQAIGVILGQNIGTTVTAQLMAFKITESGICVCYGRCRALCALPDEKA
jgi:phosphate:Na+ symporter